MSSAEYDFSAQLAGTDGSSDSDYVALAIRPLCESGRAQIKKVWHKTYQAIRNHYELRTDGATAPSWTSWAPHEWVQKNDPDREWYVAWDNTHVAGFLTLRHEWQCPDKSARTYIEHLATFPGNFDTPIWFRRLTHVGLALAGFAAVQSIANGRDGRFALHSAEDSVGWWENLGPRLGIAEFYETVERGVEGIHPGSETQQFFASTHEGAERLREAFRL